LKHLIKKNLNALQQQQRQAANKQVAEKGRIEKFGLIF
jgi:hypothetical protein